MFGAAIALPLLLALVDAAPTSSVGLPRAGVDAVQTAPARAGITSIPLHAPAAHDISSTTALRMRNVHAAARTREVLRRSLAALDGADIDGEAMEILKRDMALIEERDGIELFDSGSSYSVSVSVGTPPQTLDVMVDTGSSMFWVLDGCLNETECGKSAIFDTSASSTLNKTDIPFVIPYVEGYTDGHVGYDTVSLGGQSAESFGFGLSSNLTAWRVGAAGLMGFGPGENAWWRAVKSAWAEPQFSLYLAPFSASAGRYNSRAGGGSLTLGGTDPSMYQGNITFVNADIGVWWGLPLAGVSIRDKQVKLQAKPELCVDGKPLAMIDSGSTVLSVPYYAAQTIFSALGVIAFGDLNLVPSDNSTGPANSDVIITLDGTDYAVPSIFGCDTREATAAAHAMSPSSLSRAAYWCMPTMVVNNDCMWTLGAPFLQTVYTVFQSRPPAVGFASLSDSAKDAGNKHKTGVSTSGSAKASHARRSSSAPATIAVAVAVAFLLS